MGILDWSTGDPQKDQALNRGLLAAGLALMQSRGRLFPSIGQAGLAGLQALDQYTQQQQAQQRATLQDELLRQQYALHQQQMGRQAQMDAWLQNLKSPWEQSRAAALQNGQGPTVTNAASLQPVDPQQQLMFDAVKNGALPLPAYLAATTKDNSPITLKEGETLLDRKTFKPLAQGAPKNQDTSAMKEYALAVSQGYKGTFDQWDLERKKAGATNVSVSMDRGFGDAFAKDAAGFLKSSRDQAIASAATLRTLDQIQSSINSGKVVVGPTSTPELFLRQIGESAGVAGKDNAEKLANTRKLMQGAASLAVNGAQAMAGQGQISNTERELLARASGGGIEKMTVPEINATLQILRKVNQFNIQQHQAALQKVAPEFQKFAPFYDVQMPQQQTAPVRRYNPVTGTLE